MKPLNILVTGGSRGIGRACAVRLAEAGNNIAFTYHSSAREAAATKRLIEERGGIARPIRCNLATVRANQKLIGDIMKLWGHLDVLVANAGIAEQRTLVDIKENDWDRLMHLNLRGTFFCAQESFRFMTRRGSGNIVLMGSQAGATGGFLIGAHYSLSKAGLPVLAKILAKEGAKSGVRVNCVAPGVIDTDITGNLPRLKLRKLVRQIPMGRMGSPEEIAEVVSFLTSPAASYITGITLSVTGGLWMP